MTTPESWTAELALLVVVVIVATTWCVGGLRMASGYVASTRVRTALDRAAVVGVVLLSGAYSSVCLLGAVLLGSPALAVVVGLAWAAPTFLGVMICFGMRVPRLDAQVLARLEANLWDLRRAIQRNERRLMVTGTPLPPARGNRARPTSHKKNDPGVAIHARREP